MGFFILSLLFLIFFIFLYKYTFIYFNYIFYIQESSIKLVLGFSGITLLLVFLSSLSQRYKTNKNQLFILLIFVPLVYLFITTNNILTLFIVYELFILPSFFLVYYISSNRRGIIASIYFLMWTQIGSFLVFCAILLIFFYNNTFLLNFISQNSNFIPILIFFGFGIKVPIWPFHYWLTKTHVEAPTYFSIYLSGFLVKTALYGLWVFLYNFYNINIFYIFLSISIFGVIDSSLKMWAQVDLKKLVAYGTIQEMNLILITFIIGTSNSVKAGSLFIIAHTLLSTIFFLLCDSIYRRFNSRTTLNVRGLFQVQSGLAYCIFVCCIFFSGLPFTLKFIVEVYVYMQILNLNIPILIFIILICNWFGIISFNKHWFTTLFGVNNVNVISDISYRELIIYFILLLLLVIISFFSFFII